MASGGKEAEAIESGGDKHAADSAPSEPESPDTNASGATSIVEGVASQDINGSHERSSQSDAEQSPSRSQSGDGASESAEDGEQAGSQAAKHEEQADEVESEGETGEIVVSSGIPQEFCWNASIGAKVILREEWIRSTDGAAVEGPAADGSAS